MDEINKIPPVTRTLVAATLLVTVPCILQITNPYTFLLWWGAVRRGQIWRPLTTFFFGGGGLQFLFSIFVLLRNSTDLETNKFYRKTSDYAWALLLINTLLLAINYPLQNVALFSAFQAALVYLWARANEHASVSLMGFVNCPAKYLPYVYLLFDLLQGGVPAAIKSATGLLSAHIYYFLRDVLPATNGGRGPRYLPEPPSWLQSLLPDGIDPNARGHTAQPGGSVRAASAHTAFAPAGRSFGVGGAAAPPGQGQRLSGGGSSSGGLRSWLPSFGRGSAPSTTLGGPPNGPRMQSRPDREAMLAAAEARLRSLRENSIAGRNQSASVLASQAANSPAARARAARTEASARTNLPVPTSTAGNVLSGDQRVRATGIKSGGGDAVRRTGAGGSGVSSASKGSPFAFGEQPSRKNEVEEGTEEQETASGSGGTVAEIRRAPPRDGDAAKDTTAGDNGGTAKHPWGSGRRLEE